MGGKRVWARWVVPGILALLPVLAVSADYPPMDHGGQSLTLADSDRIWGLHANLARFEIPTSVTVTVLPYDGSTTSAAGGVEIHARVIHIAGILDATGAGYTGGGGGGGGGGGDDFGGDPFYGGSGGLGGTAAYGNGAFNGEDGEDSVPFPSYPSMGSPGVGGSGAPGDGPFGGVRTGPIDGGYAAPAANGDITTDTTVRMGSGGGGGSGWMGVDIVPTGGPGGGAGGRGGGSIRLVATEEFVLEPGARLAADGAFGGNAEIFTGVNGGDGGDPKRAEEGAGGVNLSIHPPQPGQSGGRGAGGGILIDVSRIPSVQIDPSAVISSLGAGETESFGGTVKVFYLLSDPTLDSDTIRAGRVFTAPSSPATRWVLY